MVNFELTREYIDNLQELIEAKNESTISELLEELHPADIAEIYEELSIEEAKFLYFLMDDDTAADVLTELEEDDRKKFLDSLPSDVIAKRFIQSTAEFSTTRCWYSFHSGSRASAKATALAAMTCMSGPPWTPGNTALSIFSAHSSPHRMRPPRGPRRVLWVVEVTKWQ